MSKTNDSRSGTLGGSKYRRLSVLKKDPVASTIITKLVPDRRMTGIRVGGQRDLPPDASLARSVSDDTTQNISDNANIFQLLPDTELAMQILISSILSPKDMVNVELGFRVNSKELDSELSGPMLEVIRSYFEETYKIKSFLPTILEEGLFKKGSYPTMIIPESSVDDVINGGMEFSLESLPTALTNENQKLVFKSSIGLLGSSKEKEDSVWSLESAFNPETQGGLTSEDCKINLESDKLTVDGLNGLVSVTDNVEILKMPRLASLRRQEAIRNRLGVRKLSLESIDKARDIIDDEELRRKFYKDRNQGSKQYISIKTANEIGRKTKGHPLVVKLPSESVIPVHVPSNPEEHIGYFVLLDQYGNPLNRVKEADYYRDLSSNISNSKVASQLLDAGRRNSSGVNQAYENEMVVSETVRLYSEMVERDLIKRLKNGVYGDNVEISRPMDVYQVMLARSLANMGTQILYVPTDLVSYFAFKYNQYGVGKSLLDDNKILASLRSMLLFSNTMASIKNSTGKTKVAINLDPEDPDPSSTVEFLMHQYAKHRQTAYPLGASNPLDIVDFLQNAGIQLQVAGNAAYPETTVDVEDMAMSKVQIDTTLDEDIKRKYFMSFGLSPETVDMSSDVEFATSVVTSNLLLAKRVIIYQDILTPQIKDFIKKYTENSGELIDQLVNVISANKKSIPKALKKEPVEKIIDFFLDSLEVHLPRPDSAKLENQITAYNQYVEALESAVTAYFGDDDFAIKEFDDVEENITAVKGAVISYYKREWLRNNNVLPELMDLVLTDEDGNPQLNIGDIHASHLESIGNTITKMLKDMKKAQLKRQKELEKIEAMENTEGDDNAGETDDPTGDATDSTDDEATPPEEDTTPEEDSVPEASADSEGDGGDAGDELKDEDFKV